MQPTSLQPSVTGQNSTQKRGKGGGGGGLIMEETGQLKTDLGECDLKITRPDGKCFPIPVLLRVCKYM